MCSILPRSAVREGSSIAVNIRVGEKLQGWKQNLYKVAIQLDGREITVEIDTGAAYCQGLLLGREAA